ncbi:O-methyltransferase, family 2 [Penicillium griseofulvum]|uniref:O-methyltransferase, family 2 n=1 Tax=Penicillium patulum TaxID=5078 RepID=A0A135LSJ0_PENPA|nr:O-methyltransferase, family 2 [Penicillium griseofulvum]KXG51925.1 O-methyltransferase, family 2 [Penicillium griseofulvum]
MKGGIYDLPHVIERTVPFFHSPDSQFTGLKDRMQRDDLIGGDFFHYIPPDRVYTMKWTLHDWRDPQALEILRNLHHAKLEGPGCWLIILESVRADGQSARLSRYADLNMVVATNGLERTEESWRHLAEESGWEIIAIHPL